MGGIAEVLAEILMIFQDFKFWIKRRQQRDCVKESEHQKKKFWAPTKHIVLILLIIIPSLFFVRIYLFLNGNSEKQTLKKLNEVVLLLEHEKQTNGTYPEQLNSIMRNNPLLRDAITDHWNREFEYCRQDSGKSYHIFSKGKDGISETEDDVILK